ncbi:MAG: hypothetical protein ACLPPF_10460 [Rhodomicrobium sp.]
MDKPSEGANRDAFLWKVLEQFGAIADMVIAPFVAKAWEEGEDDRKVVLHVWRKLDGEEDRVLRFTAHFDDDDASGDQKLNLVAEWQDDPTQEWQGAKTQLMVLGWRGGAPEIEKGLDSRADYGGGEYPIGKVTQGLRADIMATLKLGPSSISRTPVPHARQAFVPIIGDVSFDRAKPVAPRERKQTAPRHQPATTAPEPERDDLAPLRTSLGVMAEIGVLQTEAVFADFIQAARLASLRQRQVAVFARSALLDLYLIEKQFFEGPSWRRPSGVRIKGGSLMEGVLRTKASMFGRSRSAQEHRADRIVADMEAYYRGVLTQCGQFKPDEVDERVKRAFGSTKAIVDKAVEGFRSHVWPNWARLERAFTRRIALD